MYALIRVKNNNLLDARAVKYEDYGDAVVAMIDEYDRIVDSKRSACGHIYAVCSDRSDNYAYVRVEDPKGGSHAKIIESDVWVITELEEDE